ncbi:MAG: hypothetical protein Roseis2KO_50660 [Roseivirga sp.]
MKADPMEFEFKLTELEYVTAVRKITFGIRGFKVFFVVAVAMAIFQLSAYLEDGNLASTSPIAVLFVVMAAVFPFLIARSSRKQFRTNPRVIEQIKYCIENGVIQIKGETYSCDLPVSKILKIKETKELLLIYENRQQAHIVPKRALPEDQLTELKNIINLR